MRYAKSFKALFINTIIIGVYTNTRNLKELTFGLLLGLVVLIIVISNLGQFQKPAWLDYLELLLTLSFFCYLFSKCMNQLKLEGSNKTDSQTIFASICGYLIIGILATILFRFVGDTFPNSFNIEAPISTDYLYFSFVTLTTIGYGDIYPLLPISKSLAILFGVVGQLYLAILVAILVGKYVSRSDTKL